MSNIKHTPGPWKEDDTSIYSDAYECDLFTGHFDHDEEEFEANKRLAINAPDLFRVAQKALFDLEFYQKQREKQGSGKENYFNDIIHDLESVIEKVLKQ